MSHSIIKFVPRLKSSILRHSKFRTLLFLQLSSLHIEAAKQVSQNANYRSFTVKYLIDKCGFSRYKAVSASKYVNFAKPDKPDACFSFLKSHGFNDAQLSKLLRKCPTLLVSDTQKTLLPKIQFLHSMGFVEADITALLVADPTILLRSLEGYLVPIFDLLKHHSGSVQNTLKTSIKYYPRILSLSPCVLDHNVQLLKKAGVPSSCIAFALRTRPLVFSYSGAKMQELVKQIKKMGIDPRSWQFITGVCVMGSLCKLAWKNKFAVYQRWNCSDQEVLSAFKREPRCMTVSEEKIDGVMDFFVNEMGWSSQMLLLTPALFSYSLHKRIVPRCSVYKLLLSKGLLKGKGSLYAVVKCSEDIFLEKFINCYLQEAPELLRLYKHKKKNSINGYYSASRYANFARPDKPDACLSFFKNHGFTDAQLLKLLKKYPRIITCDPEKTLLPKIQFLHSMGFVETDITALLVAQPEILARSLEGHLVPTFDFLKHHLGSVETTLKTILSYPRILLKSTHVLRHNKQLLNVAGVPNTCIVSALRTQPFVFCYPCDKMQKLVEDIKKTGFDPRSWKSIPGVRAMRSLTKLGWKNKLEVYRRWDCSEEEVLAAFKRQPNCVKASEETIDGLMDFFVNEMGWSPQMLLQTPELFRYSLQENIVPRCSIHKLLLSKGLLKVKGSLYQVVKCSEDKFLEKFIKCYPEDTPELLRLYEERKKKSKSRYNSEDEFLEKFINCNPEEAPELLRQYEEKIKIQ